MNGCSVSFIPDTPASEDELGSHKNIAASLFATIGSQRGGKIIGLEGPWGAGKSSVISIVERLSSESNVALAMFDAWAHEGDMLRRAFLENVISVLVRREWISHSKWERELDRLAGRLRISKSRSTPEVAWYVKLFLGSLLLVPIGTAFITAGLKDVVSVWNPGLPLELKTALGLAMVGLPLLIFILFSGSKHGWPLLAHTSASELITETSEFPDPTSLEFEKTFGALMSDALSSKDRKVVLVVDNLDRVAPIDAKTIWATLRTFVEPGSHQRPDWAEKLWVIVPYDRMGVVPHLKSRRDEASITSFLDKVVQVRFVVPRTILSNWRSFLFGLLRKALPSHAADFPRIYLLKATRYGAPGFSPSPRDLIRYVNDIVALHEQWGHSVPLTDMAFWVVLRHHGVKIPQYLLLDERPDWPDPELLSENVMENLAAIEFNLPVNTARQLLIARPLREAFLRRDLAGLNKLASENEGFWSALERVNLGGADLTGLGNASSCFVECKLLIDNRERDEVQSALRNLRTSLRSGARGTFTDLVLVASRIATFCEQFHDSKSLEHMRRVLGSFVITPGMAGSWVDAMLILMRSSRRTGAGVVGRTEISYASTDVFVEICARLAVADPKGEFWGSFHSNANLHTVALEASGSSAEQHATLIKVASTIIEARN